MDGASFRQALHEGRRVFGTLVVSESPLWPRALANVGLDFVFIDTEHTTLNRTQVAWMCQLYGAHGIAPIVRLPSPDVNAAANAIDTGAAGIIAPYVETPEVARKLAAAVRLRPLKGRRRDEVMAGGTLEHELDSYLQGRNDRHSVVINIESVPAIENLDEIVAVPGVDAVLVGPHDLSCNIGVPEQYDHPDFMSAVKTIFSKARDANIGAGMHFTGPIEKQIDFLELGANMLIHCADITLFTQHLQNDIAQMRVAMGDSPLQPSSRDEEHI